MTIIPDSIKLYGDVDIGKECIVGEYTVIGYPHAESNYSFESKNIKTIIGNNCHIGSYVIIYGGSKICDGTKIEDFCRIGENVVIGKKCHVSYKAEIHDDTKIDDGSIIAGFCCERAQIGRNVRLFGDLIHSHTDPHLGWDEVIEKSPIVDDYVFIGFGAKIIGGIKVGKNSYVAAGAIVTKDIPEKSIVIGVNEITQYKNWKGKLKSSEFFERGP